MNRLFLYALLLLSGILSSCITDIDIKSNKNFKPKLVLYCRISPQLDTTFLYLTHTVPVFSGNRDSIKVITNAKVEISDNNKEWHKMEYCPELKHYYIPQTNFSIKEGKTYYVKTFAPNYDEVSASCTVPFFRETNLKLIYTEESKPFEGLPEEFNLLQTLEWKDYPNENNYYMFFKSVFVPTQFVWFACWDYESNYTITSDEKSDGAILRFPINICDEEEYPFDISMFQLDKHNYLFETSVSKIKDTDMFLSFLTLEPQQVYTNIKNGYGLFGAFVKKDYTLEKEE